MVAFLELCGALGYDDPALLSPADLYQRFGDGLRHFDQIYTPLSHGQLLTASIPADYAEDWQKAQTERF